MFSERKVCQQNNYPTKRPPKDTPENQLINHILKKYAEERQYNGRVNPVRFAALVEETKREQNMQHIAFDNMEKLGKSIAQRYRKWMKSDPEAAAGEQQTNRTKLVLDEIYERYSRIKFAQGDKLTAGTLETIIEDVKVEYVMPVIEVNHLKQKIQHRFRKENPEFEETNDTAPGRLRLKTLSNEQRQRRQILLNEVATRYVRMKEEAGGERMEDGALDRVIEETKDELGIHEFAVNKFTIRGRMLRSALVVERGTARKTTPKKAGAASAASRSIDAPLVSTVNEWLRQGISVAPTQGLTLANLLLKGQDLGKDESGKDIVLDEDWWMKFLNRNRNKLHCLGEDEG